MNLKKYTYAPMRWTDLGWAVKDCPAMENASARESAQAWIDEHRAELPTPQRNVGDVITFHWGRPHTLRGDVREIMLHYSSDWADEFNGGIKYVAYANGHARHVPETDILGIELGTTVTTPQDSR
jgi:hypothetical protein